MTPAEQLRPFAYRSAAGATLIISVEDDLYRTLPGARFTAEHIVGAQLRVLKEGAT